MRALLLAMFLVLSLAPTASATAFSCTFVDVVGSGACVNAGHIKGGDASCEEGTHGHRGYDVHADTFLLGSRRSADANNDCYANSGPDGSTYSGTQLALATDTGSGWQGIYVNTGHVTDPSGGVHEYCYAATFSQSGETGRVAECPVFVQVPFVADVLP